MKWVEVSKHQRPNATYLQGIAGYVTGTPAGELKIGDTMVWNGGGVTRVHAIAKTTKCFVWIDEIDENGKIWPGRKMKKSRIVARPKSELP